MDVLGIIPARGGSKGVPGKNIRSLLTLPLLAYTVHAAKQSTLLSQLILSSDDATIINVARHYSVQVPFVRPAQLAADNTSTLQVLQHALQHFNQQQKHFDAVCLLQPTYPFRVPGLIDACIKKFIQTEADTLFTALPVPHQYNPHWVFEKNSNHWLQIATGEPTIITQRQQLPQAFIRDGGVYVIKTQTLLQHNSLFGKRIAYHLSDAAWYVNIDTEEDWKLAEEKASDYLQQFPFNS